MEKLKNMMTEKIKKHKFITFVISLLVIFSLVNFFLIYQFMDICSKI